MLNIQDSSSRACSFTSIISKLNARGTLELGPYITSELYYDISFRARVPLFTISYYSFAAMRLSSSSAFHHCCFLPCAVSCVGYTVRTSCMGFSFPTVHTIDLSARSIEDYVDWQNRKENSYNYVI